MKFSLAPVDISNIQDEVKNVLDLVPVEELPVPLQKRECLEDINNLLPNLMMSSSCDTGEDV